MSKLKSLVIVAVMALGMLVSVPKAANASPIIVPAMPDGSCTSGYWLFTGWMGCLPTFVWVSTC